MSLFLFISTLLAGFYTSYQAAIISVLMLTGVYLLDRFWFRVAGR